MRAVAARNVRIRAARAVAQVVVGTVAIEHTARARVLRDDRQRGAICIAPPTAAA